MSFDVKIIADSINVDNGKRITTLQLRYPRFIHAEFMTHRAFSRNASSSRAIPVAKMISATLEDPAFFVHIGKNQPGMQANEEIDEDTKIAFKDEWENLGSIVADHVKRWSEEYGIHKQVANRALEPWQHMQVVCTATEWDNFFKLRRHKDAQPEIKVLADRIFETVETYEPVERGGRAWADQECWHLPYVSDEERFSRRYSLNDLIRFSVARCARVSYFLHDGTKPNTEKDLELYTRLVGSDPIHASPAEHQAHAMYALDRSNNFIGWRQYREMIQK